MAMMVSESNIWENTLALSPPDTVLLTACGDACLPAQFDDFMQTGMQSLDYDRVVRCAVTIQTDADVCNVLSNSTPCSLDECWIPDDACESEDEGFEGTLRRAHGNPVPRPTRVANGSCLFLELPHPPAPPFHHA